MISPTPDGAGKSRDEIALAYKSEPWWYDLRGFFILTFAYNSTLGAQLKFFGPNFGARHLELACGTGTLLELVLHWRRWKGLPVVDIVGVDYSESMLAGAIRRFRKQPRMAFQHADAARMPFADGSFDTVNIANSVHCFPELEPALQGAFAVLKPGGTLAANVLLHPRGPQPFRAIANRINAWGIKKGILFATYDKNNIRNILISIGFVLVSERTSGNCYNILVKRPR